MPAPATVNDLVELVRKSELVASARLDAFLRQLRPTPATPADLASLLVGDGLLTQWQADLLLAGKWRGFHVAEYRVLRPLGAGAMASVYLCDHPADGRKVAVKVLNKQNSDDSEVLKRFEREGRTVSALDHPNIVRAYEAGLDEKRHFLVMEYIDGCNLMQYVEKNGPPEIAVACNWIRQAAIGLQHIHEMYLVHRDIKPANLLVDSKGTVKIFDMGLAKIFGDDNNTVLTKRVVGTADFIAPEQTYDSHGVDIRADIYSLGLTFYYVLTGEIPFGAGTVVQKILAQRTKEPMPIMELRPEVPPFLAAIVDRMIAKDPGYRYQTPAEVIEALEPWCA
jgi:serine/threonine protein kinase